MEKCEHAIDNLMFFLGFKYINSLKAAKLLGILLIYKILRKPQADGEIKMYFPQSLKISFLDYRIYYIFALNNTLKDTFVYDIFFLALVCSKYDFCCSKLL